MGVWILREFRLIMVELEDYTWKVRLLFAKLCIWTFNFHGKRWSGMWNPLLRIMQSFARSICNFISSGYILLSGGVCMIA